MIEIKFCGISRDTKQFVYGHLMYSVSDTGFVIVETVDCPPTMQDPCGDTTNLYHGIIPETVGQFIGLKDKNGVESYAGNKVIVLKKNAMSLTGVVKYSVKNAAFIILCTFPGGNKKMVRFNDCVSFEVVGNIHQDKQNESKN